MAIGLMLPAFLRFTLTGSLRRLAWTEVGYPHLLALCFMGSTIIETRLKILRCQCRAQVLAFHRLVSIKPDRKEHPKIPGCQLSSSGGLPRRGENHEGRLDVQNKFAIISFLQNWKGPRYYLKTIAHVSFIGLAWNSNVENRIGHRMVY